MIATRSLAGFIILIGSVLLFTSCQQALAIWLAPGSTASNLVLGISTSREGDTKVEPSEIKVFPCETIQSNGGHWPNADRAVWATVATSYETLPAPTNRVTYGQNLGALKPLRPLTSPGCYVVSAYARVDHDITEHGTMGLRIAADGTVTEMTRSELDDVFR
jgi:hypothetical protein